MCSGQLIVTNRVSLQVTAKFWMAHPSFAVINLGAGQQDLLV